MLIHGASLQNRIEIFAADVGHGHIVDTVVLTGRIGSHNIWVIELRRVTNFFQKTLDQRFVTGEMGGQNFEGNITIHTDLPGQVHFSHSTFTDQSLDLKSTDDHSGGDFLVGHTNTGSALRALDLLAGVFVLNLEARLTTPT